MIWKIASVVLFFVCHTCHGYTGEKPHVVKLSNGITATGQEIKQNEEAKTSIIKFTGIVCEHESFKDASNTKLDIYTADLNPKKPKPILLILGNTVNVPEFCAKQYADCSKIVLVHPNITQHESSCMTCDVKSQDEIATVLSWVQLNAEQFGGDTSFVTLASFGEEFSHKVSVIAFDGKYRQSFHRVFVEHGDQNWLNREAIFEKVFNPALKKVRAPVRDVLIGYNPATSEEKHVTSVVDFVESLSNTGSRVTLFSHDIPSGDVAEIFDISLIKLSVDFCTHEKLDDSNFPRLKLANWRSGVNTLTLYENNVWKITKSNNLFTPKANEDFPEIETDLGPMRGRHLRFGAYESDAFYHIPFASPTARFEYSQMVEPWTDMFDARYPVRYKDCPQNIGVDFGHEDCTNLHVFVPNSLNDTLSSGSYLPVMVFMHGGSYAMGTAGGFRVPEPFDNSIYDGTIMADIGEVVVVSVNYRLAALGFLNDGVTDNGILDGNYGIRDVVLALEWVQKYIREFGGDPNTVTIFGESAGSSGAGLLGLSPMTNGIIHRVIQESGSPISFFAVDFEPEIVGMELITEVGCRSEDLVATKECLMQRDEFDFVSYIPHSYVAWRPTIDGVFLTEDPALSLNRPSNYDVLAGSNYDETFLMAAAVIPQYLTGRKIREDDIVEISEILKFLVTEYPLEQDYIVDVIIHSSADWTMDDTTESAKKAIVRASSDFVFAAPTIRQAMIRSQVPKPRATYTYDFHVDGKVPFTPDWFTTSHAQELPFVFGEALRREAGRQPIWDSAADDLSLQMITYWTNFAKTGDPNTPVSVPVAGIPWNQFNADTKEYMKLDINMTSDNLMSDYKSYEIRLWNELIPTLLQQDQDVCDGLLSRKRTLTTASNARDVRRYQFAFEDDIATPHRTANFALESDTICDLSENFMRNTTSGCVRGVLASYEGTDVQRYIGIPYAMPPIGDLRFARTEEVNGWGDGVFSADTFGPDCPRNVTLEGQAEDCLYLNIYRPNTDEILPVMVWIHNDMVEGSGGKKYNGNRIAASGNVIIVTFNYRIGVLGFLSVGTEAAPGNVGLLDQHFALKWVKDNIASFHGNSDMITVFGDSDSSAAVGYQTVTMLNEGNLFSNVIHQSGVGQMDSKLPLDNMEEATELADRLVCGGEDIIECLRSKTVSELMAEASSYPASVVIDGYFLTDQPAVLFEYQNSQYYNYLISFTSGEGSSQVDLITSTISDQNTFVNFIDAEIAPESDFINPDRISAVLEYEYTNFTDVTGTLEENYERAALDMHGDKYVTAPSLALGNKTATAQDVILRPRNRTYICHVTSPADDSYPSWVGAPQGSIGSLFWRNFNYTAESKEGVFADKIMQYWTSFAKTGKPRTSEYGTWPHYSLTEGDYIELNADSIPMYKNYYRPKFSSLWNVLIPRIDIKFTCNIPPPLQAPEVLTASGVTVRGYVETTDDGRNYDLFRGLPYAEPPTGDRRFRESIFVGDVPNPNGDLMLETILLKPRCLQTNYGALGGFADEDCLYLDIWRPHSDALDSKPVLFWICDGGYSVLGPHNQLDDDYSCNIDGQLLALDGDFILVQAHYRIGVMGFLSTGTNLVPGNAGLSDLKNALMWVYQNIGHFGGSKDKVTLAGDGFGGVLATLLAGMSSDITGGTIQSIISQSASLNAMWAYSLKPQEDLTELATRSGCENTLLTTTVSCLQDLDALKVITAAGNVQQVFPFGVYAQYNGGDSFSLDDFMDLTVDDYTLGDIRQQVMTMPTLIGLNMGDAFHFTLEAYPEIRLLYSRRPIRPNMITTVVENDIYMRNLYLTRTDDANDILNDFYMPWGETDKGNEIRRAIIRYHIDGGFTAPIYEDIYARLSVPNTEPVFMYVYDDRSSTERRDRGLETPVIFKEDVGDGARILGASMRQYWANFVNTGSPGDGAAGTWRRYNEITKAVMMFDKTESRVVDGYRDQAYKIWQEVSKSDEVPVTSTATPRPCSPVSCPACTTLVPSTTTTRAEKTCPPPPKLGTGIGLDLDAYEADVTIEVLFGLSLSFACILVFAFGFILCKRNGKKEKYAEETQHTFDNKMANGKATTNGFNELSAL